MVFNYERAWPQNWGNIGWWSYDLHGLLSKGFIIQDHVSFHAMMIMLATIDHQNSIMDTFSI